MFTSVDEQDVRDATTSTPSTSRAAKACALLFAVVVGQGWARAPVDVVDDSGRQVSLAAPAQRIVSLAPHVTELLYEVGAGDAIVAATDYSDYPDAARRLPRVGGLAGVDVERIVATRPDLVIAWRSGTPEAQLAALERLGVTVYRSEPLSLPDVASSLRRFGRLTGHAAEGEATASVFERRVATLRTTFASRTPVRVFYQVWNQPLMTIGGPHLITGVIALCGGRNVFDALSALAAGIDPEAVIAADPQLIVTASETTTRAADEAQWGRWTGVSAVRHRRYLFIDPAFITRHSSRILDGAELLCRAIDAARADR